MAASTERARPKPLGALESVVDAVNRLPAGERQLAMRLLFQRD